MSLIDKLKVPAARTDELEGVQEFVEAIRKLRRASYEQLTEALMEIFKDVTELTVEQVAITYQTLKLFAELGGLANDITVSHLKKSLEAQMVYLAEKAPVSDGEQYALKARFSMIVGHSYRTWAQT